LTGIAMLALLVLASIVDALLAILLVAVSGFIFGGGPESMGGDPAGAAAWSIAFVVCIGAPIAGFVLRRHAKPGIGLLTALIPPVAALVLASGVIRPY